MNESTLVPREEMSDLDWLARNVHVWVPNELLRMKPCDNGNGKFRASWCYRGDGGFTKDQWIARRAELQNKPSWEDAPEWATHLAQAGNGCWFFFDGEMVFLRTNDINKQVWSAKQAETREWKGEVLGDWRDTLEKRPEQAAFTPFISTEDSQEKDMTKQQETKQDSGWFERRELPPVGFECEMKRIDGRWYKAVTVGKDSGGRMVCELNDNGVFYASTSSAESFRPIRTERDELIEIISSSLLVTTEQVADAIIAAGFKLEAK